MKKKKILNNSKEDNDTIVDISNKLSIVAYFNEASIQLFKIIGTDKRKYSDLNINDLNDFDLLINNKEKKRLSANELYINIVKIKKEKIYQMLKSYGLTPGQSNDEILSERNNLRGMTDGGFALNIMQRASTNDFNKLLQMKYEEAKLNGDFPEVGGFTSYEADNMEWQYKAYFTHFPILKQWIEFLRNVEISKQEINFSESEEKPLEANHSDGDTASPSNEIFTSIDAEKLFNEFKKTIADNRAYSGYSFIFYALIKCRGLSDPAIGQAVNYINSLRIYKDKRKNNLKQWKPSRINKANFWSSLKLSGSKIAIPDSLKKELEITPSY